MLHFPSIFLRYRLVSSFGAQCSSVVCCDGCGAVWCATTAAVHFLFFYQINLYAFFICGDVLFSFVYKSKTDRVNESHSRQGRSRYKMVEGVGEGCAYTLVTRIFCGGG